MNSTNALPSPQHGLVMDLCLCSIVLDAFLDVALSVSETILLLVAEGKVVGARKALERGGGGREPEAGKVGACFTISSLY
ncbi:MAG: hypothetical protein ACP5E5_14775 [Acidobacteriaceae bacterium]